jgi:hypothetical protein
MRAFRALAVWTAAASALTVLPREGESQERRDRAADTTKARATVVPGPTYDSPPLSLSILGSGWREIWGTPVTVPLLDLGSYAGGLEIDKRGGGFQTITLHMTEQDGWREYRFRSVDKFPMQRLPHSVQGTTVGHIIQDQTASLFPAAPLLVPPFVAAVGGLHVVPQLYLMPDDPRLGEHRTTFAGMLGTFELKGEEAPDDKPGFAGSTKIKDTDKFFEDLSESRAHRMDERELLAVRLIDFLINDGDRTPDNYDWARFGDKDNYVWRPISRDRDRAFTDARGLLNKFIVRKFYPKFTEFGPTYSLRGLTDASYSFDRRLLQRLTAQDFAQVADRVQRAVTDSVIEAAIAALPSEWRAQTATMDRLRSTLAARRALLPDVAMRFYGVLAGEPDIHLTNDDERAEILRHSDGRVTVTVAGRPGSRPIVAAAPIPETPNPAGGATRIMNGSVESTEPPPFYQRTFLPSETKEVRLFLGKGDDVAIVRGAANRDIRVRVIGDSGADVLADSAGGGATHFYDSEGENRFITRNGTHVSRKPWTGPEPVFGFAPGSAWRPDWGASSGWRPVIKHMQGAGLVLGAGPRYRAYGFRRLPHWWETKAAFLVGTGNGRVALTADVDYRTENSPLAFTIAARASQLEAFRFYGYGNDTPEVGSELSLVEQRMLYVEPAAVWHVGWRARESRGDVLREDTTSIKSGIRPMTGRIQVGPVLAWTDPEPQFGAPLASVMGGESFGQLGARLALDLDATDRNGVPSRGWNLRASVAGYPPLLDLPGGFSTATASGATYLPIGNGGAHVALRAGGAMASGQFPAQYAASVGGSSTLRGYRSRRFAGDAAANGTTELRVPVGTLNFFVRSQVGVLGLADVGRVWVDGRSDGGWHSGFGGGVWLGAFGRVVNVTYAKGERHRFYLKGGLSF